MMRCFSDLLEYFELTNSLFDCDGLLVGCCPVHEGDNGSAFNINVDESSPDKYGRWFCNTRHCHNEKPGKDVISLTWMLLEKKRGRRLNFPEVINFCEEFCSNVKPRPLDSSPISGFRSVKKATKKKQKRITRQHARKYLTFPAKYYLSRGFTEESLDEFDVGFCTARESKMFGRVVFPVYDSDDMYMIGCVGRSVKEGPAKWINQKGFSKSNFLYNHGKAIKRIKETGVIIIVEGQGDVIRLWEAGIRNAVGIFGSKLSDSQEFLIQSTGVSEVIVCTDNDKAGDGCYENIESRLGGLFKVSRVSMGEFNDVGDMSVNQINLYIKPQIKGKH